MSRKKIYAAGAGLLVLIVVVLATGWWYMAAGRFPLRGDLRHDFGTIAFVDGKSSAEHTFVLTNKTDAPLIIEDIRSSCGCTSASASKTRVEPGATVDVHVSFTLVRAKSKKAHVKLLIEDFGVQTLWVEGRRGDPAGS